MASGHERGIPLMRKILSLLLVICLMATFPVYAANDPLYVEPEAEVLFLECFKMASPTGAQCPDHDIVANEKGFVVGEQYVNCIRYFYDTGDPKAFTAARQLISTGTPFTESETEDQSATDPYAFAIRYDGLAERQTISPFPDVPQDVWFAKAVSAMQSSGIITGCDDGMFHPERPVTEAELYAMLVRAGSYNGANISGGNTGEHWASGILQTAKVLSFYPPESGWEDNTATRGEAVTRIVNLHSLGLEKGGAYEASWYWRQKTGRVRATEVAFQAIPDNEAITAYIETAFGNLTPEQFAYAYSTGIAKGVDEQGNFDPDGTLTRAEAAQMFYNAGITFRLDLFPRSKTSEEPVAVEPPLRAEQGTLEISATTVEVVESTLYDFTSSKNIVR